MENRGPHKVIISGGGTGGHIFPAIAIANALKRMEPDAEILFVGASGKMEMEKVPKAGYRIEGLPIAGLQRKMDLKNLLLPFKMIDSVMKARKILRNFHPDAAVGVGGYASAPLLYAASGMEIPCLIQEQNSYAGITNKWLGRRAIKICVAYDGMEKFFPAEKLVMTGNPVRKDILNLESKKEEGLGYFGLKAGQPVLLVLGGSLGARTINDSMTMRLEEISRSGIQVVWQTGKIYYEKSRDAATPFSEQIKVHAFIERMDLAYAAADIVISRAGAISIAELCVTGKPCVLVPSPNVAEDHQTKNALALTNKKAALLVKDHEAKEKLWTAVLALIHNHALKQTLSNNILLLAKPHADDDIAEEILKLTKTRDA